MTSVFGLMRPDSWSLPLLIHVTGAAVLVGAFTTGVAAALLAERTEQPDFVRRVAFRSFLLVGLPAWFVMRGGAQWIYSKGYDDEPEDPAWIGIGYITSELGGLLLLVALILAGLASRRSHPGLGKAAGIVAAVALVAWLVAVWAMGAKPE